MDISIFITFVYLPRGKIGIIIKEDKQRRGLILVETNRLDKQFIQKVYLLHDRLYGDLSDIPEYSMDGKDEPKAVYIITDEIIKDEDSTHFMFYLSKEEAQQELL